MHQFFWWDKKATTLSGHIRTEKRNGRPKVFGLHDDSIVGNISCNCMSKVRTQIGTAYRFSDDIRACFTLFWYSGIGTLFLTVSF